MKTFNRLCWLALVAAAPVPAQPSAADFCMFQVGHGSRIERGANVPVPDLLEQMIVLGNTANPVFIEHSGGQWHLDHTQRLVPEQGSARLATPENNFAVAPDGAIWNASLGRLHVRRPSDEIFQPVALSGRPVILPDRAPIAWSSLYQAPVVAGQEGLYLLRGDRLAPLVQSPSAGLGRIVFLRDLPHFRALAIGDSEDRFFLLDATGHLRQMGQVDADDGSWWRSRVAELREQQGLLLSTDDESYLVPMQLQDGNYVPQQMRRQKPVVLSMGGHPDRADTGRYFPSLDRVLAFGRLDGFSPFRPGAALQQMSVDGWQRVPDGEEAVVGNDPYLQELPSRRQLLINALDRLYLYSPESGLRAIPDSGTRDIGSYGLATELVELDRVLLRAPFGLYELTRAGRLKLVAPIEALANMTITNLVALPGSRAALLLTEQAAFVYTADGRLQPLHGSPAPEFSRSNDMAFGIAGRNLAIFQANNGHFAVAARESGHCPQE